MPTDLMKMRIAVVQNAFMETAIAEYQEAGSSEKRAETVLALKYLLC